MGLADVIIATNGKKKKKNNNESMADQIINQTYIDPMSYGTDDIAPVRTTKKEEEDEGFWDSVGYTAKSFGSGILSGISGILEAGTTEIASNIDKGKEESSLLGQLGDLFNATQYILNPTKALTDMSIDSTKESINILRDKDKNALEKATSIANNATTASMNLIPGKALADETMQTVGYFAPENASDTIMDFSNKTTKPVYDLQQDLYEEGQQYGGGTQFLGETASVVGRMIPSIATSLLTKNPQAGMAVMGLSVKGSSTTEALKKGAELDEAVKIGNTKGMIEIGTEMLFGGVNVFGKGALDDIITKGIDKKVKNEVLNYLAQKGIGITGELVEETITDVLNTAIDKGTIDPNASYSLKDWGEMAPITILSTLVINALTGGYGSASFKGNAARMEQNQAEGLQQEIAKKQEELNNSQDAREKQIIQETINGLNEELNEVTNAQQITDDSELRKQRFTYQTQENDSDIKKAVYESAGQVMNNTEKAHKFVDVVAKIAEEKGTTYKFTNNEQLKQLGYTKEGMTINGLVNEKGEVLINIDTAKELNTVVGHETTHLLEGTKEYEALKQVAIEYAKTKGDYDTRIEKLTKLYEGTNADIEAELTSDIVGEYLFTDENFIKELSIKQPTVFEKIKNFISDLVVKFKGTEQEKQLRQLQRSFEKAYKAQGTQTTDTKYSVNNNINISDEINDYYSGETLSTMSAKVDEKVAGTLEYGEYEGKPNVKMIEVKPEYRRQGIATKLLQELQKKYPDQEIDFGMSTEDGTKLLKNITYQVENKEYAKTQKQLEKVTNRINEIETNNVWDDDIDTEYYKLLDKQRELDKKLFDLEVDGQNTKKTFVKLDQSTTDNQGRTLTKEQQEYFKDSKVRDEKGNLLEVYHGTGNKDFNVFESIKHKGLMWVAKDIEYSEGYGNNVKKMYLNIKNMLDIGVIDGYYNYENTIRELADKVNLTVEELEKMPKGKWNYIYEITNSEAFKNRIIELGYDGVIAQEGEATTYGFVNSNQIKNIDNTNPTSNPDIRYSLSEDTKGRKLSEEQIERYKDVSPEFKDENGNLKVLYHGTDSEFTVFDLEKGGKSNEGAKVGFWFTETKEGADNFANDIWYGDRKPNTIEVYVNVKNPKIYENIENVELEQQYKNEAKQLEEQAKEIRKSYSWDKVDNYQITMTFDSFLRSYKFNDFNGVDPIELAKGRGISEEQAQKMLDDAKKYNEISKKAKQVENEYYKLHYGDAYEQFKIDLYEMAGQSAEEANTGGLGMALNNPQETVKKFREKLISEGYDGIVIKNTSFDSGNFNGTNNQYVAFYPEQIKSVTNQNPTDNPDINLSLSEQKEIAPTGQRGTYGKDVRLEEAIAPLQETIENLTEQLNTVVDRLEQSNVGNIDTAPIEEPIENIVPEQTRMDVEQNNIQTEQTIPMKENVAQNPNMELQKGKQRKWIETSTESEVVNREILPDDLDQSKIFYQPITNKATLGTANARLSSLGYEKSVEYFNNQFLSKKTTVEDIALGERLIQEAIKNKDTKTAGELIQNIAILGTELGQKVQALSIIQRMTPEGQLKMLEKTINRGKVKGDKAFTDIELTQEMKDKILKTYNEDGSYNQDKLNEVVDEVKQEIADKMQVTAMDKINAWRYLSMLGNPKTHIRNLVSNVAMQGTLKVKNAVARTIETIAPIENKTKTWKAASEEVTNFAKQTALEMKDVISGDSKYSESTDIKAKRQIFKNKVIEKLANLNSDMLEKEDWWFSKGAFESSFREFLTANGISTQADIQNNPELIEKGKNYAVEQAQIATFRQYSWLANKIRDIENKNAGTQIAVGAVLPFKKTPINIAKAGLNYSPLGFAKTLTYDISQVKKGNMEASTLVDHIAQNTTGTALTLVGYMLAQAGFLNGAGDDDKEGKYDYQLGKQAYSINIGGNTYSLSWLSPVAMPLFVGANAYEQLVEGEEWNTDVVLETLGQTLDPLSEMSFLSSLDSVLSSYDSGVQRFFGIGEAMAQNYITQFVPTASSQLAATLDDTKRSTKVSGDSGMKVLEETYNKLIYKIPFLRETLEPTTDIWGNEVKQTKNIMQRTFENFIAPYSRKESIATEIDNELKDLYSQTGDNGLLPSIPYNYVNYDGEKYNMSAEEYTDYKKAYGQTANDLLEDLFRTTTYKNATSEERADMVNDVYDYARDEAKLDYLSKEGVDYTNATKEGEEYYKVNDIKGAIDNDMTIDEYRLYSEKPEKYNFFKNNGIAYSDYEENKDLYNYAYEHQDKYAASKAITGDFATYYSHIETMGDFDAKDEYGNSVNGLKKERVFNYINELDLSIAQKAIMFKMQYPKDNDYVGNSYNEDIVNHVGNLDITYEEMVEILENLGMTVKDDMVYWD